MKKNKKQLRKKQIKDFIDKRDLEIRNKRKKNKINIDQISTLFLQELNEYRLEYIQL